jgi:hypothetical protein
MKIKDLIKDLSEYKDQESEIFVFDRTHPAKMLFDISHTSVCNSGVIIEIITYPSEEIGHEG